MLINPSHPRATEAASQINACRQARSEFRAAAARGDLDAALRHKSILRDRCQGLFQILDACTAQQDSQPEEAAPC